jgi:hypothetical protein
VPQFRTTLPEGPRVPVVSKEVRWTTGVYSFDGWPAPQFRLSPAEAIPTMQGLDPAAGRPAETKARAEIVQRAAEVPAPFLRRPDRNLTPSPTANPFTLRMPSENGLALQASLGLQTAIWHNDNFSNVPNDRAIEETVLEVRPVLRLNLGDPPGPRLEKSMDSELYAQVIYIPTLHALPEEDTSRTLQRIIAEIGRANPIFSGALRYEYDENIFGAQGDNSIEDSYTSSVLSLALGYQMSEKTALHAEGVYRRITLDNPISNRTEQFIDAGFDITTSVKTTVGLGCVIGQIRFDADQFSTQHYQQAYFSGTWKPTVKITFQTRVGVELRQFEGQQQKPDRVSPVIATVLNYAPDAVTRINLGLRVHNEPSVSVNGALLTETRLGGDIRREFGRNLYARFEASAIWRDYDTPLQQFETNLRPAIGYHSEPGRYLDSVNVELFYQHRRVDSNAPDASYDRNIIGIETTLFF